MPMLALDSRRRGLRRENGHSPPLIPPPPLVLTAGKKGARDVRSQGANADNGEPAHQSNERSRGVCRCRGHPASPMHQNAGDDCDGSKHK
eukprot:scaffold29226_cov110-Isochrysis_galbana.AAC.4